MAKHNQQRRTNEPTEQKDDNVVDDVDTTAPQPVQDEPDQPAADPVSDTDRVVGRRNEDLPMENLSTPPTS